MFKELKIKSIKPIGFKTVYDITVESDHSYVANGIVNHNSASNPNFQQIPRGDTPAAATIKKMFIAPKGYVILQIDYSQAELRVMAEAANESSMLNWFNSNKDIHLASSCKKYNVEYDKIKKILDDENHKDFKLWKKRRKQAKTINFGIIYCQTAKKLATSLSEPPTYDDKGNKTFDGIIVTEQEAKNFLNDFNRDFPNIIKFMRNQKQYAYNNGYVKTFFGRKRRLPNIYDSEDGIRMEAERQCVDELTEALSKTGWKKYNELKKGEEILTKNPKTGFLEWQPIQKLNIYPEYNGKAFHFINSSFDALTTPEHKWLVNKGTKNFDYLFKTSKELFESDSITPIHRAGVYQGVKGLASYANEFFELLGIILTDGSIRRYNDPQKPRFGKIHCIKITQSYRANLWKTKRIDYLLDILKIPYTKKERFGHLYSYYIPKKWAEVIDNLIPFKKLTYNFLLSLSIKQLNSLKEGMVLGDGIRQGNAIITGSKEQANLIQMLCILCGNYSNINIRNQKGRKCYSKKIANKKGYVKIKNLSYQVTIGRNKHFHHKNRSGPRVTLVNVDNKTMWCPTIKNNTWVARRNGKQYITGNSVNAPIQGTASDFAFFSSILIKEKISDKYKHWDLSQRYTVHDSLGFYIKKEYVHKAIKLINPICENPETLKWFGFEMKKVKMKVDFEIGLNWGSLHKYDPNFDYTKIK